MEHAEFNKDLLKFLNTSPTPWHAVDTMKQRLSAAGFQELDEREDWSLAKNQGYFVIRNGSSIVAFRTGSKDVVTSGIRMVGAHTDSPCLKVKPTPELRRKGFFQLGVEVYGGVLLNPWFDRDLSRPVGLRCWTRTARCGIRWWIFANPSRISQSGHPPRPRSQQQSDG